MKLFVFFLFSLFVIDAFADEQRIQTSFKSENGRYFLQYKREKWILMDSSGKKVYKIPDLGFTSMTLKISNDGKYIVAIDDFMEGHIIAQRNAFWIFENGILKKSFKFSELITDTCNVCQSVWHTIWCLEDFGFKDNQSKFTVSTYEFNEIVFDLSSGVIIQNLKPEGFDERTFIVSGEFRKGTNDNATMKIYKYIAGEMQDNDQISFKTSFYGPGLWNDTLMIKDGLDITPDNYRNKIFINTICSSK